MTGLIAGRPAVDRRAPDPVGDGAFDALYRAQWWPMIRLAQGLVDDVSSAEDVVQDAFAGLCRSTGAFAEPGAAVRQLQVSVVNGARSSLRLSRRARTWLRQLRQDEHASDADEWWLRSTDQDEARRALAALPRRQREVLTLRFVADLGDSEIADATGMSAGHVRSAASRGLAALRAPRAALVNDADTRVKDLINSAVDFELTDHRSAPPLDRSRLAERSSAHPATRWSVPVLAASVAALVAVVTVVTGGSHRHQRSDPDGNSASPAPSMSKRVGADSKSSVAWCPHPGPVHAADRTLSHKLLTAPEATELAGVSVERVSAEDAAFNLPQPVVKLTGSAGPFIHGSRNLKPVPGRSYSFTLKYVVPSEGRYPSSGLLIVLRDVAAGSCPPPFLIRPGHTYLIRCEVTFLPGVEGQLVVHDIYRGGVGQRVLPLSGQLGDLTGIPEGSEASGVSVGPVSAQDADIRARPGLPAINDFNGVANFAGRTTPGKSYPFTVKYVAHRNDYPVTIVSMTFHGVAAGRCPTTFLARAGHKYLIRCQVTFRAGATGRLAFTFRSLAGEREWQLDLP